MTSLRQPVNGVLLRVAYDGTDFHGWASQKSVRTVQETVEGAIRAIDPYASLARGTSRTDTGVHSEAQWVAFDSSLNIPSRGWVLGLNQHLPDDVAVRQAREAPLGYNPRFCSRGKTYRYRLLLDEVRDPQVRARAWRVGNQVDLALMKAEAETIIGTHDFAAFRSSGDARSVTTRTMTSVVVEAEAGGRHASIAVSGDAFLYNMVRILVGTLVDVSKSRLAKGAVLRAFETLSRRSLGTTAPAHGLTLESVDLDFPTSENAPWPV